MQRRRRKVWEEAGAACLDDAKPAPICVTPLSPWAKAVQILVGAGAAEYLYDSGTKDVLLHRDELPRIQVEHPVTKNC